MRTVDVKNLQAKFDYWLDRVTMGEEITITREGSPLAKLVRHHDGAEARKPGCWAGQVHMAEDFDELPEDIARAFNGEGDDLFPSGRVEQFE